MFFLFQLAKEGVERDVFERLIFPYKNDLPDSYLDGFRRICAEHRFAFFGHDILDNDLARELSCHVVPLRDTFHIDKWAYIMTKNYPYKGLINWR